MLAPLLAHLVGDDAAVDAAVVGDLPQRGVEHAGDDVDADLLVALGASSGRLDGLLAPQQGDAAAGQDAFLDRRPRGVQRVLDAGLLLLHLGFAVGADRDDRHAAGELRQPLLQLLAVVVAGGRSRCALRICSIRFWTSAVSPAPWTIVVLSLVTVIFLARPSLSSADVLELDAEVFADRSCRR